ncbi:MAG: hypothetical protein HC800_04545 [Phormidesmis sp. RL_2_1]|nr:hypothetical protein [Phormidesmis sp. RL_2_1]
MDEQTSDKTPKWLGRIPKWLNDGASFVAALLGILIAWQTFKLNSEIDRLNESIEASSLIGELIGSLTSEDLKQDIALLTLDYALTSDPNETNNARENRHKKLVAEISASLLNNRNLSVEEGSDTLARSRQTDRSFQLVTGTSRPQPTVRAMGRFKRGRLPSQSDSRRQS